jgi:hypothetical protein
MADETSAAERVLREANFNALIDFLASQAYIGLGAVNHPQTEKPVLDLVYAKHAIDLLTVIEQKTGGNLTAPEKSYMENILYQLRMTFVRLQNAPVVDHDAEAAGEESHAGPVEAGEAEVGEAEDGKAEDGAANGGDADGS